MRTFTTFRHEALFLLMTSLLWSSMVPGALARNDEKLLKQLEKAESAFAEKTSRITKEVVKCFKKEITRAKKGGNLDLIKKLENQLADFQSEHRLPEDIDMTIYRQKMTLAIEQCLLSYNRAIGEATKQDDRSLSEELLARRGDFETRFEQTYPGAIIKRIHWKHANGEFVHKENADWHEHLPGRRYAFKENRRDANCVYLYDQSRELWIVLSDTECAIVKESGKPKVLYSGKWIN